MSRPSMTVQAGVVGGTVCQGASNCVPLVLNVPPSRTQKNIEKHPAIIAICFSKVIGMLDFGVLINL